VHKVRIIRVLLTLGIRWKILIDNILTLDLNNSES